MQDVAERLRQALEQAFPGPDGIARFYLAMKPHCPGRIAGSQYAIRQYLAGTRPIGPSFLEGAAKVLGVELDWLRWGDRPQPIRCRGEDPPPPAPNDPYGDIRQIVRNAGPDPDDDALAALDPNFPRDGLTRRNWELVWSVVGEGKSTRQVADETGLSKTRVKGIVDEYAELVREASASD